MKLGILLYAIGALVRLRCYWFRYKGARPSFKLTTFSMIVFLLIFTFAVIQPFAGCADSWFVETESPALDEPDELLVAVPRGRYEVTTEISILRGAYVDFKGGDVLEMFNRIEGKNVFRYEVLSGGARIKLVSLTGAVEGGRTGFTAGFEYLKDFGCVIIDGVKYFK